MHFRGFGIVPALIGIALALSVPAAAECLTGLESSTTNSDGIYIGRRGDIGTQDWAGQQFTTDCPGQFLTVSYMVKLDIGSFFGVDPLVGGDTVYCTVTDDLNQPIATVESQLSGGNSYQWVHFDFEPLELGLDAGVLSARIGTTLEGFCWVQFDDDVVPGRMFWGNENEIFYYEDNDAAFRVTWNPDADIVQAENQSWGTIKAQYR